MWPIVCFAIVGACYVGSPPCTYGDSSGRVRTGAGDLVRDLDLKARSPSDTLRVQQRKDRGPWPSGRAGRTIRMDFQQLLIRKRAP